MRPEVEYTGDSMVREAMLVISVKGISVLVADVDKLAEGMCKIQDEESVVEDCAIFQA